MIMCGLFQGTERDVVQRTSERYKALGILESGLSMYCIDEAYSACIIIVTELCSMRLGEKSECAENEVLQKNPGVSTVRNEVVHRMTGMVIINQYNRPEVVHYLFMWKKWMSSIWNDYEIVQK